MNSNSSPIRALPVPVAQGQIYHHFSDVYKRLGRKAARALPDGDSGVAWALFRDVKSSESINEWARLNGFSDYHIDAPHDCSGQIGQSCDIAFFGKSSVLLRCYWHRDV